MAEKKRIAIIGTNGIPARYGGFETLAEHLTRELGEQFAFTVYCSSVYSKAERKRFLNQARLIYLPMKANGFMSIIYDIINTVDAWFRADILLVLGPSAGFMLPLNRVFGKKLIVNCGGLDEWKREKFSFIQRAMITLNFRNSTRAADINIADNVPLQESLKEKFSVDSVVIAYGGDHIQKLPAGPDDMIRFPFLAGSYDLSVSRAQKDNMLHLVLEAYTGVPERTLVLVSNWETSEYGKRLKNEYSGKYPNIILQEAIYDTSVLDIIRNNSSLYIHSHSRCGTAPSLVEAMHFQKPVISFDVRTNRGTTRNKALYFNSVEDLREKLTNVNQSELDETGRQMAEIAVNEYTWHRIAEKYADLFDE